MSSDREYTRGTPDRESGGAGAGGSERVCVTVRRYSYRSAWIGSIAAAFRAG